MGKSLKEIHLACGKIFKNELIAVDGRSIACSMWDKMTEGEGDDCENCIGENFNQLVQILVNDWFNVYKPTGETQMSFYVYTYLLWLYLFIERVEIVFNELDPLGTNPLFQQERRSFQTLNEIRLWANFIKHPKNFLFVHWPDFIFEGEYVAKKKVLINTSYLKDHYSNAE